MCSCSLYDCKASSYTIQIFVFFFFQMEDDDDMHICLVCQATVAGLLNYINHKKYECTGKKNAEKDTKMAKLEPPMSTQQSLSQGERTQSMMQLLSSPNNQFS